MCACVCVCRGAFKSTPLRCAGRFGPPCGPVSPSSARLPLGRGPDGQTYSRVAPATGATCRTHNHSDRTPAPVVQAPVWFGSDGTADGSSAWELVENLQNMRPLPHEHASPETTRSPNLRLSRRVVLKEWIACRELCLYWRLRPVQEEAWLLLRALQSWLAWRTGFGYCCCSSRYRRLLIGYCLSWGRALECSPRLAVSSVCQQNI